MSHNLSLLMSISCHIIYQHDSKHRFHELTKVSPKTTSPFIHFMKEKSILPTWGLCWGMAKLTLYTFELKTMLQNINEQITCPANNENIIQKTLHVIQIFQNEAIGPSCNLRETRVARPGILVVRG